MSTAHTPGPWNMTRRQNKMIDIQHSMPDVKGVITHSLARVQARDSWVDEAEANARLIVAAPDLLAALQGLDEAFCTINEFSTREERYASRIALIAARAAIAKATGAKP